MSAYPANKEARLQLFRESVSVLSTQIRELVPEKPSTMPALTPDQELLQKAQASKLRGLLLCFSIVGMGAALNALSHPLTGAVAYNLPDLQYTARTITPDLTHIDQVPNILPTREQVAPHMHGLLNGAAGASVWIFGWNRAGKIADSLTISYLKTQHLVQGTLLKMSEFSPGSALKGLTKSGFVKKSAAFTSIIM